ncbi:MULTISPECIES: antibiotic biosynthesis monooxygenase family protein [Streptomyces]|uniref:antibiotic biosynthesis monooxygenase family protein n=1 Tax=Streptomyces TaxID=1883 RepID=UPI0031F101AE
MRKADREGLLDAGPRGLVRQPGITGASPCGSPAVGAAGHRVCKDPSMVTEIVIIDVQAGQDAAFAAAFRETGYELLATTPGCLSVKLHQSTENPLRFVNVNEWESEQAHLENFRDSDRFVKFGQALGPYLAGTPVVEHFTDVTTG